ncbi:MAG: hypothetical protein KC478_05720 [Bacteriovoracaceae bacterium]|nr:hypothetical protein [Bacteriovoracaceae bacterium]
MKITMIISLVFGTLMFSGTSFAAGELNSIIEGKEQSQSSAKKSRRKKVQMCNDCGKPETECECEGHGEEGHEHDGEDKH